MDAPSDLRIQREDTSLRKRVEVALRDAILYGSLYPGQKLLERDLCAQLGVSRTLLREALQQLQAEGLITNVIHKGPSVAVISEEDAREIYDARQLIEGHLAYGFTERATEDDIDRLARTIDALRVPGIEASPSELLKAKNGFYEVLFAGSGNQVLAQMLQTLNNRVTMLRRRTISTPGRLEQSVAELDGIVEAIRRRDAAAASTLCRAHVERAASIAIASFATEKPKVAAKKTRRSALATH